MVGLLQAALLRGAAHSLHSTDVVLQSLYTGVYSRGGPTNIEPSNELSALLDRSPADVRGVKFSGSPGVSHGIAELCSPSIGQFLLHLVDPLPKAIYVQFEEAF